MRVTIFDDPSLNLEQSGQIELTRHGSLQPTDLEADIALFEEWLEPAPHIRCNNLQREWLRQPQFQDVG